MLINRNSIFNLTSISNNLNHLNEKNINKIQMYLVQRQIPYDFLSVIKVAG